MPTGAPINATKSNFDLSFLKTGAKYTKKSTMNISDNTCNGSQVLTLSIYLNNSTTAFYTTNTGAGSCFFTLPG
jgi:hypothetical protein